MKETERSLLGGMFVAGLGAVALHNLRLWRRDKQLLESSPPRNGPLPQLPRTPRVSALVAAWNEAGLIEEHIRSFLALSYPDKELVLCAGGTDGTYNLARGLAAPQVKVLEQRPGEGKQAALRRCLEQARGEIIVLADADCLFTEEAFLRLIEPIAAGQAVVTTGVSEPRPEQRDNQLVRYQWFGDVFWAAQLPPTVDGVLGRNCALRRDVLEEVGALDAVVHTGTDYYLSKALTQSGYEIVAVPGSRVATEYAASARAYVSMWRRWNKNLLIHGFRFGAWRDIWRVAVAAAAYGATLALPWLSPFLGRGAAVVSLLLFATAAANRTRRIAAGARLAGARLGPGDLARVPAYTLLDMLAVLLAVRDSVDPHLRTRW